VVRVVVLLAADIGIMNIMLVSLARVEHSRFALLYGVFRGL